MSPLSHLDAFIDRAVDRLGSALNGNFYARSEAVFAEIGDYAAAAAVLLVAVIATGEAFELHSGMQLAHGIGLIVLIAAARYAGRKLLPKCRDLVERNPSSIGGAELPRVLGVLWLMLFAALVITVLYAMSGSTLPETWTFAAGFDMVAATIAAIVPGALALAYMTILFFNIDLISTSVAETTTPAQTALSLMAMWLKAGARLAPIMFGGVAAVGVLQLLASLVNMIGDTGYSSGLQGIENVIGGLLYPFAIYLLAIFLYIFVDLCRTVLSLQRS